ncbi:GuaB3 family IMP dehydrogenase-related protein [Corynebacterium felinum]|uniref:IMP dehydrogenase n=1 Tax=Corynebacterium felinum TaxID=131318 RepID=A0ABU2B823_9CORY|nr:MULTISPECIES: GuaB3 family IMP dehydrogenase-related protein [Corynebacterium]MDF5820503.1 GuaB3 family IMP dehydrogenase-related protein [Corynebacterium felinum]MDO4760855.1 GuaB3 family IMP dehydrogenase-related protein [Corynebacterium sp.]MDR7354759.1 IMP dehydrogenase [Corynebacterium felinum]WJY94121.1 putative oxidoreductase [Corynebacterium felinum]
MRDYIEIGIGREARRTYSLTNVRVQPARRTRSSKDVDTSWHIDAYSFKIPVVSHPTDALGSPEFVIEMDRLGGLGVINAEGLLARHADFDQAIAEFAAANLGEDGEYVLPSASIAKLQELHAAPIDLDLLTERIQQVRASGATVAVRVSPQRARELAPIVIKAGAELLFIQGAVVSAEHVAAEGEPLNLKEFISTLEIPVVVGGVHDYTTALHLMRTGAVGVIVGSGVNTAESLAIQPSMATAIADVAAARRDYLDETGGRYVHILADGEIYNTGNMIAAIACGADAVILGSPLAAAAEAPGQGFYWPSTLGHPRFPRGIVDVVHDSFLGPRPRLEQILHGPSQDPFGAQNFVGGLRRAVAKCGYEDLKSFQRVDLSIEL